MQSCNLFDRWNAHQSDDRQLVLTPADIDEAVRIFRKYARLLRLLAGVDLDEAVETSAAFFHFSGQRTSKLGSVNRLDHIEHLDYIMYFVGL